VLSVEIFWGRPCCVALIWVHVFAYLFTNAVLIVRHPPLVFDRVRRVLPPPLPDRRVCPPCLAGTCPRNHRHRRQPGLDGVRRS